jgi:hypothetical protein
MPAALPQPAPFEAMTPSVAVAPAPRLATLARATAGAGIVVLAAGLLGFLTSAQYNRTLGREGGFSDDTVLTWFVIGLRSLVPPFVFTLVFLVIGRVLTAAWFFTQRLIPPARRVSDLTRTTITGTLARLTGSDPAIAAQALLLAQVLGVALAAWFYRDLIVILPVIVNDADPAALAVLDPAGSNGVLYSYGAVLSVLLASMWIGWHRLVVRSGAVLPRGTVVAGGAVMLIVLLLMVLPYRLYYHSEADQVSYVGQVYGDQVCYAIGSRGDDRLLYCPALPKHQRLPVVKSTDVRTLNRRGALFARSNDSSKQP